MRLLAFVDLHDDKKALEVLKKKAKHQEIEMVLCSGDITLFGRNQAEIVKLISEFEVPVLMIHGNHEEAELLKKECDKYKNMIFIHNASFRIGDYIFFGYGGGGFAQEDGVFVEMSKNFSKEIKTNDKKIVLLHGPPFGANADFTNNTHVGNRDYMDFIETEKIDLVICGHIHETAISDEVVDGIRIVNPGKRGVIIDL